jgi:tetratricopeptide (TPR) repeat protein
MKYIYLLLSLFIYSTTIFAQTYEERISDLSCELIQDIDPTTDVSVSMKKCILHAKFEIEREFPELTPKVSVEELREKYKIVFTSLTKDCKALATKNVEYKKHINYVHSANKEAKFNFDKGAKLAQENEFKKAIAAYKKAIRLDQEYILAYDQLGAAYLQIKESNKAEKSFEDSLKRFPEGDVALQNLAQLYYANNDNKNASKTYATFANIYPENPIPYLGLAKTAFKDALNEVAFYHCITALNYAKTTDTNLIKKTNSLIKSIYTAMETKSQIATFNDIAKEHNFNYETNK